MAEVKWIKVVTDLFDDEKIKLIRKRKNGDTLISCWIQLLCLAGKQNHSGYFILTADTPMTVKMLADICERKESEMQKAFDVFESFGMILNENGTYFIPNWEKHQSISKLEKYNAYHRDYMSKARAKQKQDSCDVNCDVNDNCERDVTVNPIDKNRLDKNKIRIDKNRYIADSDESAGQTSDEVRQVIDAWNSLGLQTVTRVSGESTRGKMLRARIKEYGIDEVLKAIEGIRSSDYLKGQNKFNWVITLDWFVKPSNFAKVYEGNYAPRSAKTSSESRMKDSYDMLDRWAEHES